MSRHSELATNYNTILHKIKSINRPVTLIAVSKFKPASDIQHLYNHGVRHFGENYVQELITKANDLPKDIKWHFIGGLQLSKCKDLAKKIPNLYSVEAMDNLSKCQKLNTARESIDGEIINIYLQINTSKERQKSGFLVNNDDNDGISKGELYDTINYLLTSATKSNLKGLMTIGSFTNSISDEDNPDFTQMVQLKSILDERFLIDLELSMGMSNDFEQAIKQGSTCVRVGSSIFGTRPVKPGQ